MRNFHRYFLGDFEVWADFVPAMHGMAWVYTLWTLDHSKSFRRIGFFTSFADMLSAVKRSAK